MTFDEPVSPEIRFGEYLRRERELRDIPLADVARRLKMRQAQIEALESGTWDHFPAAVYLRGAIRDYARAVGLDGDDLLVRLDSETEAYKTTPSSAISSRVPPPIRPHEIRWRRWLVAGILLVGVVAAFMLWRPRPESPTTSTPEIDVDVPPPPPTAATTITAAAKAPTEKPAPEPTTHEVRIEAQLRSWVAYRADAGEERDVILPPGESFRVQATREVELRTGNAGGLTVYVDGVQQDALGPVSAVVRRTYSWSPEQHE